MSDPRKCREPGLFSSARFSFQDRVDCRRRLAIILAEQVSIDAQRDVRLRVTQALADRHDVDVSVDQLAGVSVGAANGMSLPAYRSAWRSRSKPR
jgi:hypothetical protein